MVEFPKPTADGSKEGSGISSDSSESLLLSCNAVKTNIQHSTELGD
jgi:hypothetical protein